MQIQDNDIIIRNAEKDDCNQLATWCNDGSVMTHAGFPLGLNTTAEEIKNQIAKDTDETRRRLIIEYQGQSIGEMSYHTAISQDSPIRFGVIVNDGLTGQVGQKYFFYYDVLRPMAGEDGMRLWGNGNSPSIANGYFSITDKCKYPKIAMQWADYFYTQQGTLEFYRGIENESWKWNEDGTYVHLSVPADLGIDQNTWVASQRYGAIAPGWFSKALRGRNIADMSLLNGQSGQKQWRQTAMYVQYQPEEFVPTLIFTADESEELSYIQDSLFNYVTEMEAKFVSGQVPLSEWDAYVSQLQAMGLDQLMSIYQTAYDRLIGK